MKTIIKKYNIEIVQETSKKYDGAFNAITSTDKAVKAFNDIFNIQNQAEEVLALICLDTKNKIIGAFEVSRGTLNASMAHPREVFKRALLLNAARIMLCHNHPSGELEPSSADDVMTERLFKAGELMGIELLDHIILANASSEFYSYRGETNLLMGGIHLAMKKLNGLNY